MDERDPKGLARGAPGAKMDDGKPPVVRGLLKYFPLAVIAIAEVSEKGAKKYSWNGWEHVDNGVERYTDAMGRHLLYECFGATDTDTGCLHAAQVAWNAMARLELILRDKTQGE